jgi:hypothetical protein
LNFSESGHGLPVFISCKGQALTRGLLSAALSKGFVFCGTVIFAALLTLNLALTPTRPVRSGFKLCGGRGDRRRPAATGGIRVIVVIDLCCGSRHEIGLDMRHCSCHAAVLACGGGSHGDAQAAARPGPAILGGPKIVNIGFDFESLMAATVARERNPRSLCRNLRCREEIGQSRIKLSADRHYCLDDLIPIEHPAVNAIILGFMQDGEHFISYQAGNSDCISFELVIWKFDLNLPLRCVSRIPLFICCSGSDFNTTDTIEELSSPIRIRMIEIATGRSNPSAVLVHASSGSCPHQESVDAQRHSMSLILNFAPEAAAHLCALHTTYFVQPPYPVLEPRHSLLLGYEKGTCPTATLVINTGDSIRFLNITSRGNDQTAMKDCFLFDENDFEDDDSMRFTSCSELDARVEWHCRDGSTFAGEQNQEDCSRNIVLRQSSFDVESYLAHLLTDMCSGMKGNKSKATSGKFHLADYDLRIVESAFDIPESSLPVSKYGHCCVALGVLAVLKGGERRGNDKQNMGRAEGATDSEPTCTLVSHLLLLCCKTAQVLARLSNRACSCPAAAAAASARSRLVQSELRAWRAMLATPGRHTRTGPGATPDIVEWDNDGVLEGRCAERLVNPVYPIVITPPRRGHGRA